jgi:hypothetical protein
MKFTFPVCGFPDLEEKPLGESTGGSYEICPSCGFQFGVSDDDRGISFEEWRKNWIAHGMPWNSVNHPSDNWDPRNQLRSIGVSI